MRGQAGVTSKRQGQTHTGVVGVEMVVIPMMNMPKVTKSICCDWLPSSGTTSGSDAAMERVCRASAGRVQGGCRAGAGRVVSGESAV